MKLSIDIFLLVSIFFFQFHKNSIQFFFSIQKGNFQKNYIQGLNNDGPLGSKLVGLEQYGGIAFDDQDNVMYITDSHQKRIRQVGNPNIISSNSSQPSFETFTIEGIY